ncbi:hypothetical protein ACROYT_G011487 [Oculina patagonica]
MSLHLLSQPITEAEEQQFCVEMMKRLDIQRKDEQLCDVILEIGSGDDQARLKAHRNVLCAASPFFYNALNSDMKEKKEGVIRLEETSKAVMEEVLEYLYTGHVDINEAQPCDLMAAADYFLLPALKNYCANVILQTMSFSNCLAAYYLAVKYRCEALEKKASDFILANFVAVADTEDFLNLTSTQVEEWISSDEIIIKGEEEVFEVAVKWIERNKSRNQSIVDVFRHIRFIYIARDFLFNVILSNPLMKDNLECSNVVLDAIKLASNGTEECYFSQPPRNCLKTHEDAIVACGTDKSTLCYIPSENKWYKLAKMLHKRPNYSQNLSSCHKKLYCIGGNTGGHPAEYYDPLANSWTPMKSFNRAIKYAAVVSFQGLLYVIGGRDINGVESSTVQRYNPDTNLWQEVASLSIARCGLCAVADKNFLYAIGGGVNGERRVKVVERFHPIEKAWKNVASTLERRADACGAAVNQKVFVFGGEVREASFCEVYDPAIDMWSSLESTIAPRGPYISAVSFKGKVFVCSLSGQNKMSLQVYDADSNEWKSCTNFSLGPEKYSISCLRIPREILDERAVVS